MNSYSNRTLSSSDRAEREQAQVHAERYISYTLTATRWYEAGNHAMGVWCDQQAIAERDAIPARLHGELDQMYVHAVREGSGDRRICA